MVKLKEYNGRFCESDFENAFICLLENEGWKYILGNNISRTSKRDVLRLILKIRTEIYSESQTSSPSNI